MTDNKANATNYDPQNQPFLNEGYGPQPTPVHSSPALASDPHAGLRAQVQFDADKKSTAVTYVLWAFFGGLGIHNFYLGKKTPAIWQLSLYLLGWATVWFLLGFAFFTVVGVWLIVELFTIPGTVREINQKEWSRISQTHGIN